MNETDRSFKFVGGALCLDFANTVGWASSAETREPLAQYERFDRYPRVLEWAHDADLLDDDRRNGLLARVAARQDEADDVLRRAIQLRAAVHWLVVALIRGEAPVPRDLDVLNYELRHGLARRRIDFWEDRFSWKWVSDDELDHVLYPVAQSAADLLVSGNVNMTRECAGDPCGFLFVDTSPKKTRRWCVMGECGNRAKARRHYRRLHVAEASE